MKGIVADVALQSKLVESGGTVKGVPCAEPKCLVFLSKIRSVTDAGSMIRFQDVASFGGVSSVGTSSWVTRDAVLGLRTCFIFR